MKKILLSFFALVVVLSSCYYDEGPIISLRTPQSRLVNTWKFRKYVINGQDQMNKFKNSYVEFKKDKTAYFFIDTSYSYTAAWYFDDEYKTLHLNCSDDTMYSWDIDYNILKLRAKEIWLEGTDGIYTSYIELIEK